MAKVIAAPRSFTQRLRTVLADGLKTAGLRARIQIEPVRRTKLHRVVALSSDFENLRPSERQNLVWRIIDQQFTPDEQLLISMIYTLTPDEARDF